MKRLKTFNDLFTRMESVGTVPQSLESERSILGAMMLDKNALYLAMETLGMRTLENSPFYHETHTILYQAMCALVEMGKSVDYMSVWQHLTADVQQRIPLMDVVQLTDTIIATNNLDAHLELVLEKYRLRELIACAKEMEMRAYLAEPSTETLERHEANLFHLRGEEKGRLEHIAPHVEETLDRLRNNDTAQNAFGLNCGIVELDRVTGGAKPGQIRIIAARPSQGKSALAVTIALGIVLNKIAIHRAGVAIFSLEMTTEEFIIRMLANRTRIDSSNIERNHLSIGQFAQIEKAREEIMSAELYIDQTPGLTPLELKSRLRRLKMKHKIDHVIIDYLQIMQPGVKLETREREVSHISQMLKNMAKELKISIDVLSQLNRAMEQRADKRPALSDLRESGSLEQDAHVVIMPYYPERKGATISAEAIENVELMILKNRNGRIGMIPLQFNKPFSTFEPRGRG